MTDMFTLLADPVTEVKFEQLTPEEQAFVQQVKGEFHDAVKLKNCVTFTGAYAKDGTLLYDYPVKLPSVPAWAWVVLKPPTTSNN